MIKKFPVIYSKTSHGQTQTWRIETENDKYRTVEGLLDGALTTSAWTIAEPKNVGKKNETTGKEQALKEAKAKHKAKLDEGYHEKLADIDKQKFFEPMTAKKWKDRKKNVVFPVYSQPKLDGMRCIVKIDGMWSRYGKKILSAPHIFNQLKNWLNIHPHAILDGELYTHKFKKDFEKIISLARQGKPTEEDIKNSEEHLEYWIYDFYNPYHPELSVEERNNLIREAIELMKVFNPKIKIIHVPLKLCKNEEELDAAYREYLHNGMEGQMVRIPGSIYENKRSNNLLKRKEFIDKEFELVDVISGKGGHEHLAAKVVCKMKDGRTFEAGMIGSHEYCAELLKNKKKYIGKMVTIVFQRYSADGIPIFGKCKIIRDYE